eukprot:CAMPEP_0194241674 /NCGR_PEP_ID=MMETSP0158-20130606/7464_1 /TAXON_ID=33649 /ORGANISM="Thalassionema nitzschioides, Strain L26-B" /LENGTH=133 /DNA_ID=CAMNT_0038976609 /DNA_START=239 /DNA_END=640 /DNA_ORIENTATION=-
MYYIINAISRLFEILQAGTTLYIASKKYDLNEAIKTTLKSLRSIFSNKASSMDATDSINNVSNNADSNVDTNTREERGQQRCSAPVNEWEQEDMYSHMYSQMEENLENNDIISDDSETKNEENDKDGRISANV